MKWQRARTADQKAERRAAILTTAAALFETEGYDAISLNGIARAVGLAKSNLYRYFQSKEAIFLALLEDDHAAWAQQVVIALAALDPPTPTAVADTIARTLAAHPRLCALAAIAPTVLEHGIDSERLLQHKTQTLTLAAGLLQALQRALPDLDPPRAVRFIRLTYALVTGLWPASHPPEALAAVLARPEFGMLRLDFERDLADGLALLLAGLLR